MSNNYYSPPNQIQKPQSTVSSPGKIVAPGIALIVVGALGLLVSSYNVFHALTGVVGPPDPNLPDFVNDMEKGAIGPVAAFVQTIFVLINVLIISGGIAMTRVKLWALGIVASIVAIINFGSFCCVLGMPVGIWSLVILFLNDVRQAFQQNQ